MRGFRRRAGKKTRCSNATVSTFSMSCSERTERKESKYIRGEITVPNFCFYYHPAVIKISLQDTSRIDRPAVDITSCCIEPDHIYEGEKFQFALECSTLSGTSLTFDHQWYTLQVRIEDMAGNLLCFNHRVTRAIDDDGQPLQWIQIPLTKSHDVLSSSSLLVEEPMVTATSS